MKEMSFCTLPVCAGSKSDRTNAWTRK